MEAVRSEEVWRDSKGAQKRAHVRIDVKLPISYCADEDQGILQCCESVNLSKGGIYICTRQALKPNQFLNISLPVATEEKFDKFGHEKISLRGRVVHNRPLSKAGQDTPSGMGIQFYGMKNTDWYRVLRTLSLIMERKGWKSAKEWIALAQKVVAEMEGRDKLQLHDIDEKSASLVDEQFPGKNKGTVIVDMDGNAVLTEIDEPTVSFTDRERRVPKLMMAKLQTPKGELFAYIVNLSRGGVGLVCNHPMTTGTEVALFLGESKQTPLLLAGEIVYRKALTSGDRTKFCYGVSFHQENKEYLNFLESLIEQEQAALSTQFSLGKIHLQ